MEWLPGADEATIGFVQNKGWRGAADVLAGYRNLETFVGAERAGRAVVLPTDANDTKGWDAVYEKLGRPTNPDGYQLPVPEGVDPGFSKAAAAQFHALGLPKEAGQKLTAWWNAESTKQAQAEAAAEAAQLAADNRELDTDWGSERPMRTELARRAMVQLGMKPESVDSLEKVAGYAGVMKALAKAGDLMREHGLVDVGAPGSFATTPEGARAKRAELMADKDFAAKAMDPTSSQWKQLQELDRVLSQQPKR